MARKLRCESNNGFYHIRDIGINHFFVFEQKRDKQKFLQIMVENVEKFQVTIIAFCIMDNHFHILAAAQKESVSLYMKTIKERFAQWYNYKYDRTGALFNGRYRCDAIKDSDHFWETLRYIHLNPLRAALVKTVDEYEFCSYNYYVKNRGELVDCSYVFSKMSETEFVAWHLKVPDFTKFENFTRHPRLTDEQAIEIMKSVVGEECNFAEMPKELLNITLAELRRKGLAIRQISRLTGVPRWFVEKVKI